MRGNLFDGWFSFAANDTLVEATLVSVVVAATCLHLNSPLLPSPANRIQRLLVEVLIVWAVGCAVFQSSGVVFMATLAGCLLAGLWLTDPRSSLVSASHHGWSTIFSQSKGGLMLFTAMCILGADLPIFPSRFLKTQTWGISVMDTGVGSFALVAGVGASNAISGADQWSQAGRSRCKAFVISAVSLAILGFMRIGLLHVTGLSQPPTEYGLHWNFFFTLAGAPPLYLATHLICASLRNVLTGGGTRQNALARSGSAMPPLIVSAILILCHEVVLNRFGWEGLILSSYRGDLFTANKEGTCTLVAYAAIFGLGVDMGTFSRRAQTPGGLWRTVFTIVVLGAILMCWSMSIELPSRRLANAPFIFHTVLFNGLGALVLCSVHQVERSVLLSVVSYNEMGCFLLANVATGIVNLNFAPSSFSLGEGRGVLLVYISVIALVLHSMQSNDVKLRFRIA